jgi:hypothetical protein
VQKTVKGEKSRFIGPPDHGVCEWVHATAKADPGWFCYLLTWVGIQRVGYGLPDLMLANCPHCGTTLAYPNLEVED